MFENHKTPVTVMPGHSYYIRFRVIFDRHLDQTDLVHYNNIVAAWYLDCCVNATFGRNYDLRSFDRTIKYMKPVYVTRFDVAHEDISVADKLLTYLEDRCFSELRHSKVQRIEIAFSDVAD